MKNIDFLMTTPLWKGLKEEEIEAILPCLRSEEKFIKKGEFVYRMGDPISSLGVLLQGKLSIEHDDLRGNKTILSMITPGNIFAETYACVPGEPLMVNIVAIEDSRILCLNMLHLLTTCERSCPHHNKLIRNLLAILAQKNLHLSRRSFHTAAKTIRARLLSYLSYEASRQGSLSFDIPFNRQQLADYLNLDRSALSNELSKMQKEQIIICHRNHFLLHTDSFDEMDF